MCELHWVQRTASRTKKKGFWSTDWLASLIGWARPSAWGGKFISLVITMSVHSGPQYIVLKKLHNWPPEFLWAWPQTQQHRQISTEHLHCRNITKQNATKCNKIKQNTTKYTSSFQWPTEWDHKTFRWIETLLCLESFGHIWIYLGLIGFQQRRPWEAKIQQPGTPNRGSPRCWHNFTGRDGTPCSGKSIHFSSLQKSQAMRSSRGRPSSCPNSSFLMYWCDPWESQITPAMIGTHNYTPSWRTQQNAKTCFQHGP